MYETAKETLMYRSVLWTLGEGKGGEIWENGIEICKICLKQITSPGLMHDTGCSGLMHWDDPEGWGTYVHPWWMKVNVWQNQYNIVK